MIRYLGSVIFLTIIYVMTLASFDPWDFAMGALLATGVYIGFQGCVFPIGNTKSASPTPTIWRRIVAAPLYVFVVVANITRGSIQVMLMVLKIRPIQRQGLVGVPWGDRSELGVVVSGYADTLSPGSVIVDFDHERQVSWTHVIEAADPDGFRAEGQELYDKYQRHVVP